MKSIEDDFQGLADEIITGKVTAPDPKQKVIVDAFYALCRAGAEHRTAGADPVGLNVAVLDYANAVLIAT
jgi:hypothetical protein